MENIVQSPLFVTFIGLLGAWVVGNALTTRWQLIRKRKELELETAQSFYRHYGEFFAIWKIWHQVYEDAGGDKNTISEQSRFELHERAAAMEGGIEATLLKIASEIRLSDEYMYNLGQLRQAFGVVRYCIRHRMTIPFFASDDIHYLALKCFSTAVGVLLARPLASNFKAILRGLPPVPTAKQANDAWREITSNEHEKCWKEYLRRLREGWPIEQDNFPRLASHCVE